MGKALENYITKTTRQGSSVISTSKQRLLSFQGQYLDGWPEFLESILLCWLKFGKSPATILKIGFAGIRFS